MAGGLCWHKNGLHSTGNSSFSKDAVSINNLNLNASVDKSESHSMLNVKEIISADNGIFDKIVRDVEMIEIDDLEKIVCSYDFELFGKFGDTMKKMKNNKTFFYYFFYIIGILHLIVNILICVLIIFLFTFSCKNWLNKNKLSAYCTIC